MVWNFYGLTCFAMSARCGIYLCLGKKLHDSNKHTRPVPTWPIPPKLLEVCGTKSTFLRLLPIMLAAFAYAATHPDDTEARLAAAAWHTFFSMGCAYALEWGHGQYPVLWMSWALAASALLGLGKGFEVAAARAVITYLYLSAGLAKLCVPANAADYFNPGTMQALMSKDGTAPRFNPLLPSLSKQFIASPTLLSLTAAGTLVLELFLVPATFLCLPGLARWVAVLCMCFHGGIWATFSSTAGTMFFQLSGIYALMATDAALTFGSAPWLLGVVFGMSPAIHLLLRGNPYVQGERWPCTNCALFPWSKQQVDWVMMHLGASSPSVKMVLTATRPTDAMTEMVGLRVTSRGQQSQPAEGKLILHNVYGNLWNWTKVYPTFVAALNVAVASNADAHTLIAPVEALLKEEQPLIEVRSGRPLLYARVVKLDPDTGLVVR